MGTSDARNLHRGTKHLIISLLLLLGSSWTHERFMAEAGRSISKMLEAAQKENGEEKLMAMRRNQIGSSPPRCEGKCSSCTHCEAIQVPVTAQTLNHRRNHSSLSSLVIAYSRDESISNYKPMSWKCKCGNFIFNP